MPNYSVKVVINAIDKASGIIERVRGNLGRFGKTDGIRNLRQSWSGLTRSIDNTTQATGRFLTKMGLLAGAAGFAFKGLLLDKAVEFEKLNTQLTSIEGSSQKARQSMSEIIKVALNTPNSLQEVIKTYRDLRNAGINPMQGALQSIIDANARVGGSNLDLMLTTKAITQMWAKMKITSEEMTGQLAERNIPGWTLLSQAMKKPVPVLMDMAKKGQLTRKHIALLIQEVGKWAKGSAQRQMTTFAGMLGMIEKAWDLFAINVMNSGLFQFLKQELSSIVVKLGQVLNDPKIVSGASKHLIAFFKELKTTAIQIWPVIKGIGQAISSTAKALGGYGNLLKVVIALMASGVVLSFLGNLITIGAFLLSLPGAISATIAGLTAFLGSIGAINLAIGMVIATSAAMAGAIVAGVALVVGAGILLYQNWTRVSTWFANMWQTWGGLIRLVFPPLALLVDFAELILSNWYQILPGISTVCNGLRQSFKWAATSITQFFEPVKTLFIDIGKNITWAANQAANLAKSLPNVNIFTSRTSNIGGALGRSSRRMIQEIDARGPFRLGAPVPAGRRLSMAPAGAQSINNRLEVAMRIDAQGRTAITDVKSRGPSQLDFKAAMGMATA